jgi:signal transduction histidine kinase/putative methionine-R-sulfoxide reductase with GAF domain
MVVTERSPSARPGRTRRVAELARLAAGSREAGPVLAALARAAIELLPADGAAVWLTAGRAEAPRRVALAGRPGGSPVRPEPGQLRAPIQAGARTLGVLTATITPGACPGDEDRLLLAFLAASAGGALEAARQRREGRRVRREARLLHAVARALAGRDDLESMAAALGRALERRLETRHLELAVWRPGGGALDVVGPGAAAACTLLERVAASRRPLRTADHGAACRAGAAGHAAAPPYWLGVPLAAGPEAVGALVLRRARRPFTAADRRLLGRVAELVGPAVRAARLLDGARRRQRRLGALLDVTQRLTRGLDLPALLAAIAGAAAEVFEGEAGFRVREGHELVRVGATPGALAIMPTERLKLGESISGRVATTGEPVVSSDLARDERLIEAHRRELHGLEALMCLPVRTGGELLGTLNIYRAAGHVFDAEEVALGTSFADQAAIAIANARLFARTEARRREAEAVADVGHVLAETLDPDVVSERVVEAVARLLGARSSALYSLQPAGVLAAIASYGTAPEHVPPRFVFAPGMGVVGRVVEDGRAFTCTNLLTDPRVRYPADSRRRIEALTYRAALGVPLQVRGRVIGALFVADVEGRRFTERDTRLAETFADQAALALESARLFRETERALADLRTAHAELDSFVYSVSHDLKAPLVAAQGMAGALLEDYNDVLDPTARHYLARLQANVQHMERLIQDLLALSRVGREGRPPEAVPLDEVVGEVLAELAEPLRARGVQVEVGRLPVLRGIRTQVEQVMANLVGNALKYLGDAPAPRIEIGAAAPDAGGLVECFVRDNGIGIDPAYHARVFEIFQRLGEVKAEGTGVGLAIVRKIVEGAGGRVWVESARGAGATFRFTWPVAGPDGGPPPASRTG